MKSIFKLSIVASVLLVSIASSLACEMDDLYSRFGFAEVDGGYENLVGVGQTENGERFVIGGGNHASGDLGATFPWVTDNSGKLQGHGFNDMMVSLGNKFYMFRYPFTKQKIDQKVLRDLIIDRDSNGRIKTLSMKVEAFEVELGRSRRVRLEVVLAVTQNGQAVVKKEGFKRFDVLPGFMRIFESFDSKLQSLGLLLTESALVFDVARDSWIAVSYPDGKKKKYQVSSFLGALEKSSINITATKKTALTLHMQYDYVAFYPVDTNRCGDKGFVAYISGLLNRNQGALQSALDRHFLRKYGSSAFFIGPDGLNEDLSSIQSYGSMKTVQDVLKIKELNLRSGRVLGGVEHALGPGVFDRKLVEFTGHNGCVYAGMLEIQLPR